MITISSLLGCRSCLQSDGIRHMYSLINGDEEYQKKTEFEVMKLLERWRANDGKKCEFCGSSNVEVYEVEVNNYTLYDFDSIVQRCKINGENLFIININKKGADISLRQTDSAKLHPIFHKDAIKKVIDTLHDIPNDNFISQTNGHFFICVSGGYDIFSEKAFINVERISYLGLTREAINSGIEQLAQQVGISIFAHNNNNNNKH